MKKIIKSQLVKKKKKERKKYLKQQNLTLNSKIIKEKTKPKLNRKKEIIKIKDSL